MKLQGSCHCKAVTFTVHSAQPVPFMRCYCSICRKTAGGGGYAINLGADFATLQVQGEEHLGVYQAKLANGRTSSGRRHFCVQCGSALWLWDETWPDLVHPHASAIDSDLPVPPAHIHMMLGSRANWAEVEGRPHDLHCDQYPETSLAEWHEKHRLTSAD